jgi:hypothetical protein
MTKAYLPLPTYPYEHSRERVLERELALHKWQGAPLPRPGASWRPVRCVCPVVVALVVARGHGSPRVAPTGRRRGVGVDVYVCMQAHLVQDNRLADRRQVHGRRAVHG